MGSQDKGTRALAHWPVTSGEVEVSVQFEFGGPDWLGIAVQGLGGQNRIQEFRLLDFQV